MSTLLRYAHDLLDRTPEDKLLFIVKAMEEANGISVWTGPEHKEMDIPALREAVKPVAERHGVERVYLFGSRARGDNRPDSDYDFMISAGKVNSLWRMSALWQDMEDAVHAPVDVITDNADDEQLIAEARKDAVLLYEQAG